MNLKWGSAWGDEPIALPAGAAAAGLAFRIPMPMGLCGVTELEI
jgi:hypothetical protein